MDNKEVFYTSENGVRDWEDGLTFEATHIENYGENIRFTVSSQHILERNSQYVIIDTGSDADL